MIHRTSDRITAWSPRTKRIVVIAIIGLAFALPLRGLLRNQGPPMEEGFMLVFPERVLHGDFPNKDFLHLYGPGSLWVLAGWMKVLGVTLTSERLFALLQQIGVVGGVYWLARAWGRRLALCCALLSLLFIVPPLGLTALAWVGGVALGLLGLGLTLAGRRRLAGDPARAARYAFFGGLVGAGALLFRLDLVVAVVLGALAATAGLGAAFKRRYALGLGIGLLAYVIQLATAGPYNTFKGMVLDPVVYLRGGRRLPIPPSWDHLDGFLQRSGAIQPPRWPLPHFSSSQQLFIWFFFMIVVVVALPVVGAIAVKRTPRRFQAHVLFASGLFGLGMISQGIQRVDSAHFAWVSCVSVALLPVAVFEALRHPDAARRSARGAARSVRSRSRSGSYCSSRTSPGGATPTSSPRRSASTGSRTRSRATGGRSTTDGPTLRGAAQDLLAVIPKYARPGDKLFVGPTDLRKTPYSDAYLYYLLPEYPPGTYYIEMDPGVANADGLAHAEGPRALTGRDPVGRVERLVGAQRLAEARQQRSRPRSCTATSAASTRSAAGRVTACRSTSCGSARTPAAVRS